MAVLQLDPTKVDAVVVAYERDGVPRVRQCAGNVDAYLLRPAQGEGAFLACTLWESEAHAKAYEASGLAQQVASLVKPAMTAPPELRTYVTGER